MDTIVSRSSPLSISSLHPVRAASPAGTQALPPGSIKKVLFLFNTHHQSPTRISSRSCLSLPPSPLRKSTITRGSIAEINEGAFPDAVLKSDRPVLVEFVATWCGPCRLISPAMEWLAQVVVFPEYGDKLTVVKIDHDANPKLIEEYKVYGLPTLILFKEGREVPESRREGAITKAKLKEYIDTFLETISVS